MNTWTGIGRLTDAPEVRYTPGGTAVADLRLAVNYDRDTVDFFTVTTFNKSAENAAEYLVKGQRVAVTGHLKQHQWTDGSGEARSRIEIVADRIEYLDAPKPKAVDPADDAHAA
jgi:single-strand DNA-binding protein